MTTLEITEVETESEQDVAIAKKKFISKLSEVVEKFNIIGVKEFKAISLVYQTAFKITEQQSHVSKFFKYHYTPIDISSSARKHLENYKDLLLETAMLLIATISKSEAFDDLMTEYVEVNSLTNKNLGQFFTPKDVASVSALILVKNFDEDSIINKLDKECDYLRIGDDCGCGAGSMVLAMLREIKNLKGFEDKHYKSISIYLNDLDEDLPKIAFFQVVLNSLIHNKIVGRVEATTKNIISEFDKKVEPNLFIANMSREVFNNIK